ncbi:MAG: hypothetical protein WCP11_02400 [Candidatus Saccharibacteria bacterium]
MEHTEKNAVETLSDGKYHRVVEYDEETGKCCFVVDGEDNILGDELDYPDESTQIDCLEIEVFMDGVGEEIGYRDKGISRSLGRAALCVLNHKNQFVRLPISLVKTDKVSYIRGEDTE